MASRRDPSSAIASSNFMRGWWCKFGEDCPFAHGKWGLGKPMGSLDPRWDWGYRGEEIPEVRRSCMETRAGADRAGHLEWVFVVIAAAALAMQVQLRQE